MAASPGAIPAGQDRTIPVEALVHRARRGLLLCTLGMLLPFVLIHGFGALITPVTRWQSWALALPLLVIGALVHEGLHALAMILAGRVPLNAIRFGVMWEALAPYAHCTVPMSAHAYRVVLLLPGLALGVVPALISLWNGDGGLLIFGYVFTTAALGDWLVYRAIADLPATARLMDHPEAIGCVVLEEEQDA